MAKNLVVDYRGKLTLTVVSGMNLIPKDPNGKSDPYVLLELKKDAQSAAKNINVKNAKKTKTIKENLNPRWNETVAFGHLTSPLPLLKIEVWDYDVIGSDDFMGEATIDLKGYFEELRKKRTGNQGDCDWEKWGFDLREIAMDVPLKPRADSKDRRDYGKLTILIDFEIDDDLMNKLVASSSKTGNALLSDDVANAIDELM